MCKWLASTWLSANGASASSNSAANNLAERWQAASRERLGLAFNIGIIVAEIVAE